MKKSLITTLIGSIILGCVVLASPVRAAEDVETAAGDSCVISENYNGSITEPSLGTTKPSVDTTTEPPKTPEDATSEPSEDSDVTETQPEITEEIVDNVILPEATDYLGAGSIIKRENIDNLTWTLYSDGLLSVTGSGKIWKFKSISDGLLYQYIIAWDDYRDQIKTVKVSASIEGSMEGAFANCPNLTSADFTGADTSKVTNMGNLFGDCPVLVNVNLSGVDTSAVTEMCGMFSGCSSLKSIDVSGFDTSKVTRMDFMFDGCTSLTNLDVSKFDMSKVELAQSMFSYVKVKKIDLSGTTFGSLTRADGMFSYCTELEELNLNSLNNPVLKDTSHMFNRCKSLKKLDLSKFDTSKVTDMYSMFNECVVLEEINLTGAFSTASATDMTGMFLNCYELPSVNLSNFNTSNVTSMLAMFSECYKLQSADLSGFDFSEVVDMGDMFLNCESMTYVNLGNLNAPKLFYAERMFANCPALASVNMTSADTRSLARMECMFYGCSALESIDLSALDVSQVTDMSEMFNSCTSLESVNLSGWNVGKVTDFHRMFYWCTSLTTLDLSSFHTDSATNMSEMFRSASSLQELDISNFNTAKVTDMSGMFNRCYQLFEVDLSKFNTSNVTNMNGIFESCSSLRKLDLSTFNFDKLNSPFDMLFIGSNVQVLDISSVDCSKPNVIGIEAIASNHDLIELAVPLNVPADTVIKLPAQEGESWVDESGREYTTLPTNVKKPFKIYRTQNGQRPSYVTVDFDPNGGYLKNQTISYIAGSSYGFLPNPTREGYLFDGWYYGEEPVYYYQTVVSSNAHTLVAHWVKVGVLRIVGTSLTIDANIGLNLYLEASEEFAKNARASVWDTGEPRSYDLTSLPKKDGYYVITVGKRPTEIDVNSDITIYYNNKKIPLQNETARNGVMSYSVNDYIVEAKKKGGDLAELASWIEAYSRSAQEYFYGVELEKSIASKIDSVEIPVPQGATFTTSGTLPDWMQYLGSSLVLGESITLRHYFQGDLSAHNIRLEDPNNEFWPRSEWNWGDSYFHVDIPNINPLDIDKVYSLKCDDYYSSGWQIDYSVLSYLYKAAKVSNNPSFTHLTKSLYKYWEACEKYWGQTPY